MHSRTMTKRLTDIESPFTGGRVFEICDVEKKSFRGEEYTVHVRYYICEDTGEEFTAGQQDELWTNELYGRYRMRHCIPFPEEIVALRTKYGLSYAQFSKILGFGINVLKNYELGQVPSVSNGRMLRLAMNPQIFQAILLSCRGEFSEHEFKKLNALINKVVSDGDDNQSTALFYGNRTSMTIDNGFGKIDSKRVCGLVSAIMNRLGEVTPTKLNKLMFYSDFSNYRCCGKSISGLCYRAIQYGPVPENFDSIYDNVPGMKKDVTLSENGEITILSKDVEESIELTKEELAVVNDVINKLGNLNAKEIVELSHREEAWKNNVGDYKIISYSEAFSLKGC